MNATATKPISYASNPSRIVNWGRLVGASFCDCDRSVSRNLTRVESGIFSLVAGNKRICTRSIWLGAVADVCVLGYRLVGVGRRHLVSGPDQCRKSGLVFSDRGRYWRAPGVCF
jgi:hypothetical protein